MPNNVDGSAPNNSESDRNDLLVSEEAAAPGKPSHSTAGIFSRNSFL